MAFLSNSQHFCSLRQHIKDGGKNFHLKWKSYYSKVLYCSKVAKKTHFIVPLDTCINNLDTQRVFHCCVFVCEPRLNIILININASVTCLLYRLVYTHYLKMHFYWLICVLWPMRKMNYSVQNRANKWVCPSLYISTSINKKHTFI